MKNIAFLMDRSGAWSLSPAFDLTYSYNPSGMWTSRHQMSVNGKRGGFDLDDFRACAAAASMKRGRAEAILGEVATAVTQWRRFAQEAGVPDETTSAIEQAHRMGIVA